jgi:RNA polymerase sigma factor (TIGR02999 family)
VPDDAAQTDRLLVRAREGDPDASRALFARIYDDLRRVAGRLFRSQRGGHTLAATALVHEAYLKMAGASKPSWNDRAHALAVGARAMRQVLANHARDRAAQKRGGDAERARVTLAGVAAGDVTVDLVAVHEAFERLEALDERQARIAQLRLLGGLSTEEIATLVGVSTRTVELDWRMAKRVLARSLGDAPLADA